MDLFLRKPAGMLCIPFLLLTGAAAVSAQEPGPSQDTDYDLVRPSQYEYGCFDGCECPVFGLPMQGGLHLVFDGADPLFTHYLVQGFEAVVADADGLLHLSGSGTYKIGGEVAVTQQMTLDLDVGGTVTHFDSGLVSGGAAFPAIVIDLAASGFACRDTVLALSADPAISAVGDPPLGGVLAAAPNPFRGAVELRFIQASAGPLGALVFDARGRLVRDLAESAWSPRGTHAIEWDGREDGGREAPSGIYFVRIRAPGREWRRMVVKLE